LHGFLANKRIFLPRIRGLAILRRNSKNRSIASAVNDQDTPAFQARNSVYPSKFPGKGHRLAAKVHRQPAQQRALAFIFELY
jgi:hypothetical protein